MTMIAKRGHWEVKARTDETKKHITLHVYFRGNHCGLIENLLIMKSWMDYRGEIHKIRRVNFDWLHGNIEQWYHDADKLDWSV